MFQNKQIKDLIKENISIEEQCCIPQSSHLVSPQVILSPELAHDITGDLYFLLVFYICMHQNNKKINLLKSHNPVHHVE